MDKDMIQGKLTELSGALKQNFGNLNLSEDELK